MSCVSAVQHEVLASAPSCRVASNSTVFPTLSLVADTSMFLQSALDMGDVDAVRWLTSVGPFLAERRTHSECSEKRWPVADALQTGRGLV